MKKIKTFLAANRTELFVFLLAVIFSWWLMFSTFSYKNGNMLIATKAWSDFASHIPLIRSFSFGSNLPPQYPLFAGPPIKYHFLFYLLVGVLEKSGLRIDYAFNLPSVLGFSFLILMIFKFSKLLFNKTSVAFLSILFFLFNGSLSFIKFFTQHPISKDAIDNIILSNKFASFGPYDGSIVSAFWNLNIYTNQRHLALSYGVSLFILYFISKPFIQEKQQNLKINFVLGLCLGLSFFLNIAVFLMTIILLGIFLLLFKKHRLGIFLTLLVGGLIGLPQYFYTGAGPSQIAFYPGYLINNLNLYNFINYWFLNLGLSIILIPLAFIFVPKKLRFILLPFFLLFIVGNLFKFSAEIAANHKFFNYFIILGNIFTAYFLVSLWNKKKFLKPLVVIFVSFLILSGVLDFFPVLNDTKIALADYPNNKEVSWIINNTPKTSVFLNTNYLYDNASIAGRNIFLGWPYFAWSQGYDTLARDNLRKEALQATDKYTFCKLISKYEVDYAEINLNSQDATVNKSFFDGNFKLVYKSSNNLYYIYKINNCL